MGSLSRPPLGGARIYGLYVCWHMKYVKCVECYNDCFSAWESIFFFFLRVPVCKWECVPLSGIYICFCVPRAACRWMLLRWILTELTVNHTVSCFSCVQHLVRDVVFSFYCGRILLMISTHWGIKQLTQLLSQFKKNKIKYNKSDVCQITIGVDSVLGYSVLTSTYSTWI